MKISRIIFVVVGAVLGAASMYSYLQSVDLPPPGTNSGIVEQETEVGQDEEMWKQAELFQFAELPQPQFESNADVNGDGKEDAISLEKQEGGLVLRVNNAELLLQSMEEGVTQNGFLIVDVDRTDAFLEIAIDESSDPNGLAHGYTLVRYDGSTLRKFATVDGDMGALFPGDKTALTRTFYSFWTGTEKKVLQGADFITEPQDLYYVGLKAKVTEPFTLIQKRDNKRSITQLQSGDYVHILAADLSTARCEVPGIECGWYLILSPKGVLGWADVSIFHDKLEGIVWAN